MDGYIDVKCFQNSRFTFHPCVTVFHQQRLINYDKRNNKWRLITRGNDWSYNCAEENAHYFLSHINVNDTNSSQQIGPQKYFFQGRYVTYKYYLELSYRPIFAVTHFYAHNCLNFYLMRWLPLMCFIYITRP